MLFSTNIFIWTAVSCNCSEGTAASDYPLSWDGKSYFQVGHGSAEQTICNLWSLGCATPVGMLAGQCWPTLGSRQKPPGCSPCQCWARLAGWEMGHDHSSRGAKAAGMICKQHIGVLLAFGYGQEVGLLLGYLWGHVSCLNSWSPAQHQP